VAAAGGLLRVVAAGDVLPQLVADPVDVVVTEAATFRVREGGLILVEVADVVTLDWVRAHTTALYQVEVEEAVATPSR
jgi:acyl CoA:acetate/3-ketoacid CoA transferase beta subunit